jgi:translocator protein
MKQNTKAFNLCLFIIALAVPITAGIIGSLATNSQITTWYATLSKPSFNPPNWVFGPVWSFLYLLQGIAFYVILNQERHPRKRATGLFLAQITLNLLWSLVFFGMHQPVWALVDIVLLWGTIIMTMWSFSSINYKAAQLFWPYLAWVTFATALNIGIVVLNFL